jgi:hypothetical protein
MKRMQCDRKKRKKYKPRSISKTDATTKMNKNPFLAIVLSDFHCCEESEAILLVFLLSESDKSNGTCLSV